VGRLFWPALLGAVTEGLICTVGRRDGPGHETYSDRMEMSGPLCRTDPQFVCGFIKQFAILDSGRIVLQGETDGPTDELVRRHLSV